MNKSKQAFDLLTEANLSGQDLRVLLKLLSKLEFKDMIGLNQADLSRELNIHTRNVNRSIKKLVEIGVIQKGLKVGVNCSYRVNPHYGWKELQEKLRDFEDPFQAPMKVPAKNVLKGARDGFRPVSGTGLPKSL